VTAPHTQTHTVYTEVIKRFLSKGILRFSTKESDLYPACTTNSSQSPFFTVICSQTLSQGKNACMELLLSVSHSLSFLSFTRTFTGSIAEVGCFMELFCIFLFIWPLHSVFYLRLIIRVQGLFVWRSVEK